MLRLRMQLQDALRARSAGYAIHIRARLGLGVPYLRAKEEVGGGSFHNLDDGPSLLWSRCLRNIAEAHFVDPAKCFRSSNRTRDC